jgi:haloalkane dehalogenase
MERREFLGVAATGTVMARGLSGSAAAAGPPGRGEGPQPAELDAAAFHAARRYFDSPFGRIAYVERGRGEGALFLHGFPVNGFQWRGALERLAPWRRCIAPDFLGLGYTEVTPGGSCTPATQVEMLTALLDGLGVGKVDLIANDSGGAVAQLYLVRHPERVRSLLLTNCDVEPDSPPPAVLPVIELARAGTFGDQMLAPWLADKRLARSDQGLGGLTYTYRTHPTDEAIEMYLRPLLSTPEKKAHLNAYALGLTPNPLAGIEARLRSTRVPARILWGTGDDIFSAESPGYLHRVLPGSRGVRLVEGAKLFWPEEFPDLVAEEAKRLWGVG